MRPHDRLGATVSPQARLPLDADLTLASRTFHIGCAGLWLTGAGTTSRARSAGGAIDGPQSQAGCLAEGSGGPFDLVNGIPVHPLVVHAAVVFVPLTALGMIVMAIWPRFSAKLGWLVAASAVLATVFSFAAKESGEVLEGRVGEPGYDHAELGDLMPIFAAVLLIAVVALWLIDRSAPVDGPAPRRGLRITVAIVGVLIALGNLVWVYRVGDSGAKSVWSGEVTAAGSADSSGDGDDEAAEGSGGLRRGWSHG